MILIDNRNVLRMKDRELLNSLTAIENSDSIGNIIVEQSKTGILTLKITIDGRTQYMHSKYDPEKEAERFVNKYENETFKHVLFVGTGLGYHIKKFTESHPNAKFSIYEPDEEVLLTYLTHAKLDALPLQSLTQIFTGTDTDDITDKMQQLLQSSKGILQIITLPIYERIYGEQINAIMKKTLETLKDKRSSLATNFSFQQRWTINSIKNFPTVLKTPNILQDIDKSAFEGKPAIIVAAGPSLNEEFENLRYIKENGLAYIFSVGSAINALIEHGIYPDAACTYDPTERNQLVIQRIKDENITDIPLVFGSTVGFETLEDYPGKMLHMITSQDTIAPQLLDTKQAINVVMDAPSIAVVTFQLLNQLQCNPIILVGQNLGYQDNKRYAAGIDYDFVENELNEDEQKAALTVKDVYGNDIQTNDSFNRMRQQLEFHIQSTTGKEILNTTTGGAQIEGALFIPFEELISERLTSQVVHKSWANKSNSYDIELTRNKLRMISLSEKECRGNLGSSFNQLKRINNATQLRQSKNMENRFTEFDREFEKVKQNIFYKSFLEPMVRVQYDILSEKSQRVRFERDGLKKAEVIVHAFTSFLVSVFKQLEFVQPYFEEMKERIE
ncbi:6-hydroxymethylpterin diphosphokinase MptE-like protein [Sporosarcina psychrophila]|uniref:motility associated factor glycosyltransferase family protein n=1 Tax=Sporosarcina psychrophila TaxID=1476 RepID=UPI0030D41A3A